MANFVQIRPTRIEEGLPITVVLKNEPGESHPTLVILNHHQEKILATLEPGPGNSLVSQFALYQKGNYELISGSQKVGIEVYPRSDLSFVLEFWILALTVVSILGGLLIWSRKRKS